MPELEKTQYKFPDEQEATPENEAQIEIEVEDDTPPEDRGKTPMPKPLVEELEKDELDKYGEEVKVKLKQMRKVWHDERREKESALREQQEAVRAAQYLLAQNKHMKALISSGEKEYVSTIQNSANLELEVAKKAFKDAYDSGDGDRLAAAQQAMSEATIKIAQAKSFRLPPLQEQQIPVQPQTTEQYQPQRPDPKAMSWQESNPWFGTNKAMTAFALGLHDELADNGIPVGSNEYYAELDKTIRKRFPDVFESDETQNRSRGKPGTVVAPAMRSTASNKLKLRASQVQLAKKLGLTPEQYAKEVLKLEAQNAR